MHQRVEAAAHCFPKQALEVNSSGGLYSSIGRTYVGLTEADISDLTATKSSRNDVFAARQRAALAKSTALHGDGVVSSLLAPKQPKPLPTTNPPYFRALGGVGFPADLGTTTATGWGGHPRTWAPSGSPKRSPARCRSLNGGEDRGVERERMTRPPLGIDDGLAFVGQGVDGGTGVDMVGLESSRRERIVGADGKEHAESVSENVRRLRELLVGEEACGEARTRRPGSPSLLSVHELRALGSAKRLRGDGDQNREVDRGTHENHPKPANWTWIFHTLCDERMLC